MTASGHAPWVFAHRGLHAGLPGNRPPAVENTLAALESAYVAGCDGVEFDVQLTADGVPVIFHDDDLQRLAGVSGAVHALAWSHLRDLDLVQNGVHGALPTLEAFLERCGERPYYLELKVPEARRDDETYLDALAQTSLRLVQGARPHALTFVASFHWPLMRKLAEAEAYPRLGVIYEDEAALETVLAQPFADGLAVHSLAFDLWQGRRRARRPLPPASKLWLWGLQDETALRAAYRAQDASRLGGLVIDDMAALLRVKAES